MNVLEIYETTSKLTRRMLGAAREQNWDDLISAGVERDRLLEALPESLPQMTPQESERAARLIKEILACHSEISERANPWLEHTATLLAAFDCTSIAVSATQTRPVETR